MSQPLSLIGHPTSGRVFVLGAGFSYHLSGGRLPLLRQLAEELDAAIPWLRTYQRGPGPLNIERILTDLDLDITEAPDETARVTLRGQRRHLVHHICERLDPRLPDGAREAATALCTQLFSPGDYILTFNWDVLLEKILTAEGFWKSYDGYGWSISITQDSARGTGFNPFGITILKLHGSVNFVRPSYGGKHLTLAAKEDARTSTSEDADGEAHGPLLTLPTYVKYFAEEPGFVPIWREAIEAMTHAKVLVMVGYSLPKADALARLLLSFGGTASPLQRIAIVNWTRTECEHVRQQLREVATLHEPWPDYDEVVDWQLLPAVDGDAYERLLAALSSWPRGNPKELAHWIADRADFPGRLEFVSRLMQKQAAKKSSAGTHEDP